MAVNFQNIGVALQKGVAAYNTTSYVNVGMIGGGTVRQGSTKNIPSISWGEAARSAAAKDSSSFTFGNDVWGSHKRTVGE